MATERLKFEFDGDASKFTQAIRKSEKSVNGFSSNLAKVGGVIAGAFAVDKIMEFGISVIETNATFQRFESVLTNTLGSSSEAQKALDRITDFASKTPFSVSELTDSFVRLANQGFKPTSDEMQKLGDIASSTGKDFLQLTEAIIDAQVGEFERLKEFGIRASKQGDQVTFTFKGVKTQVDFTADSIQNYILGLGELEGVQGAMIGISKTLGGQISNLGDTFDMLKVAIGERLEPVISGTISTLSSLFSSITNLLNPQEALINEFKEAKSAVDDLEEASFALSETQRNLVKSSNDRKKQNLADVERRIKDETENLNNKLERQKLILDAERSQLEKINDVLEEFQNNENSTSKSIEYQTDRLLDQSEVVEEQQKKYDDLNKVLSEFNRKLKEARSSQKELTDEQTKNIELTDSQKKVFDTIDKKLNSVANRFQVFGHDVNVVGDSTKILGDGLVSLLDAGVAPANERFKELQNRFTNLTNATNQSTTAIKQQAVELTNGGVQLDFASLKTREFAETTKQTGSAFGELADGMQQIGISVGLAFAQMAMQGEKSIGQIINSLAKMIVQMTVALVIATALRSIFDPSAPAVTAKNLAVAGAVVAGAGILALATKPNEEVQGFAKGGIITKPVMGMIGEGNQPEAVIPLNRLPQMVGNIGGNQKGEFTLRGQDLILALERAGDFRARITG